MKFSALRNVIAVCSTVCAILAAAPVPVSGPFYLRPNDTVVFYGDSITDQRLYTMLTELFAVTRYPAMNLRFVHSGWGGDRVTGGGGGPIDVRLHRDVAPYSPTVMTIMLGMNDGKYANHTAADDDVYYNGYRHIVESVRQAMPALRITAIKPSPFDDVTRPLTLQPAGYNAVLVKYGDWIGQYAAQAKFDVADLNTDVVQMLRAANATDPALAQKIIPDRIHPGVAGHLIMAEQLLKAWHARPVVSAVSIDAAKGRVAESSFATISDFHASSPLVWTQLDDALPFPLPAMLANDNDHTLALVVRSSDFVQALNQQIVRVTGLAAGKYKLTVDGENFGTYSDIELATGVNLSVLQTPMVKQAMEVRDLTVRHLEIHQARWRTFQVPLQNMDAQHLDDALKAADALESDVIARQREAAKPGPHVFQLAPAA